MTWKKKFITIVWTIAFVALLAGCGTQQKKVITFGAEMTYPPFEYSEGDAYKGFDIDLGNAIAKEMGVEAKFVGMGFDALIPALQSHQIDAIASGIVITPERLQKINFTNPYYQVNLVMVVKNTENTINTEADIAGKTVGAQIGTTGAFLAEKLPGTTVKQFDTIPNMLQDLQNGAVQLVMLDEPIAKYYIQKNGMKDLKIIPVNLQQHDLGIGINKDDKQLLEDMNKALQKLKDNGEYDKLVQKWFGDIK